MLPYVEILEERANKLGLNKIALVEPSECWFELSYYEIGEFELDATATTKNMTALKKGNYIKLPNKSYIWVIKSIKYSYNEGVRTITAKGYEAKWLLSLRVIRQPLELPTNLAQAVYNLVAGNLGNGANLVRQIQYFTPLLSSVSVTLSDTQAPRANLSEFVLNLLKSNKLGSIVTYDNGRLNYKIVQGQDKSASVRFSQSYDNLLQSEYSSNDSEIATNALVVSTVEDVDYLQTYDLGAKGVDRAEILINSNISTEYTPTGATDPIKLDLTKASDLALYYSWQRQEGKNELANHIASQEVNSTLDLVNSIYEFEDDYFIGDIVGVQDDYFNYKASARITKITIKQDAEGYGIEADYETVKEGV